MRQRAGGILIENGKILLIHRIKIIDGIKKEYYVIPGGGIEENEILVEATKRELLEEVGIEVNVISEKPIYTFEENNDKQSYLLIEKKSGNIGTGNGPEFTNEEYSDRGLYLIEMIELSDILEGKINLLPEVLRESLILDIIKISDIKEISSKDLIHIKNN